MTARATLALSATALTSILLTACASSHDDEALSAAPPPDPGFDRAYFFAASSPRFATIQRNTHYTVARDDYRDLFIIEEDLPSSRLTWLIALPVSAPPRSTLNLGPASAQHMGIPIADAWLLEEPTGAPTHSIPAAGIVEITARDESSITANISLTANPRPLDAGELPNPITLNTTITAPYSSLTPIAYAELDRREGIDPILRDDREPPIWIDLFEFPHFERPNNRFHD